MFAARRLTTAIPRAAGVQSAFFHSTRPAFVKIGDAVPDLDVLVENSPGNKVNLATELQGKGVIVGVPAAFSMSALCVCLLVGMNSDCCAFGCTCSCDDSKISFTSSNIEDLTHLS
jgi:hypothetical protein